MLKYRHKIQQIQQREVQIQSRAGGVNPARLEIQGVPPIAVEALLDYCYKDKLVSASFNILLRAGLTVTMSTKVRTHQLTS